MEKLKEMVSVGSMEDTLKCQEMRQKSEKNCPKVKFILETMEAMGCAVPSKNFYQCFDCNGKINGGFELDENNSGAPRVVLCQNHLQDQAAMDRTLTHELIHAFDQCRAKVDWNNCEHQACTEVRAAALSGDCDWINEVGRANYNFTKQHQICARRRAELSLSFNDKCVGKEKECVEKVFEKCYKDTLPFLYNP